MPRLKYHKFKCEVSTCRKKVPEVLVPCLDGAHGL